jgi:hypothetical protein
MTAGKSGTLSSEAEISAPTSSHAPQIPRLINMFTITGASHHIALVDAGTIIVRSP